LLGDALKLAEKVKFRFLSWVAPFCVDQALGKMKDKRGWTDVAQVLQIHIDALANDAGAASYRRTNKIGGQLKNRVVIKLGNEALLRQFNTIPLNPRKTDFEVVSLGTNGFDLHCLAWRVGRSDNGFCREIEGNAENVRILGIEEIFLVEVVRLAAQSAADDLLAEKLCAEGADALAVTMQLA
jgi:hypothetical protein